MRVKGGLVTLIYRKSLVMSNGEKAGRASGDIVNLQSVDAVRIGDLAQYGQIAWSGPFQIILAFVSLYNLVGWQAFTGVAIMVVSLPINTMVNKLNKKYQREMMKTKDKRTRAMNEILNNIKSIKLYGWEGAFADKVFDARNNLELRMLRKIGIAQCVSNFFWQAVPFLVSFSTFATFVATSKRPLTSEIIFPAISLFQLLSFPMAVFANIINSIIEAIVSIGRLEDFLAGEELDPDAREVILNPEVEPQVGDELVSIKNGEFRWIKDVAEPTLQDIDLSIKKGELMAIIGRVGDGKSSLLSAILGEMTRSDGKVTVRGDIAYFSQNSWILSATVKDNITFGHRFDPVFYDQVLDACALRSDLAVLPQGHMTEVGEKGVSLSGGQKARICLARACYARADIYLLDDPLSAVDAHVGRHIFDRVIGPNGILKNKARLLCTNAVTFLPQSDQIVMVRRGIILERGNYHTTMANPNSELYKLITGLGKQTNKSGDNTNGASTPIASDQDSDNEASVIDEAPEALEKVALRRRKSNMRRASSVSIKQAKRDALKDLRESSKPKEHSEKGNVKREVYKKYIAAASKAGVFVFLLFVGIGQAGGILSNYVLRWWARENSSAGTNANVSLYLGAYFAIGLSGVLFSVGAVITIKLWCALRSSRHLHDQAFSALMRSPLSFFELTPTGRILNLFSRDIFVIDEVLVMSIAAFVRTVSQDL
jgi:ATP-binding cassette subfamily C (CFTR/MRP) protein 1